MLLLLKTILLTYHFEDFRLIAALHSSRLKGEQNERMYAYDDDDDSTLSDDSMASSNPDGPNTAFSPADLSTKAISLTMIAIRSSHTTTAEHYIDSFTRRKLQQLDT